MAHGGRALDRGGVPAAAVTTGQPVTSWRAEGFANTHPIVSAGTVRGVTHAKPHVGEPLWCPIKGGSPCGTWLINVGWGWRVALTVSVRVRVQTRVASGALRRVGSGRGR